MPFALEVLQAKQGDCLILHYGTKAKPHYILIDGGPTGVYKNWLDPRLSELRGQDNQLELELVMVSHIDDDHIKGVLDLAAEMASQKEDGELPAYKVKRLWHNSFADIVGDDGDAAVLRPAVMAGVASSGDPVFMDVDDELVPVLANVPQGRELRQRAKALSWSLNSPFKKLAMLGTPVQTFKPDQSVKLTVLGPRADRVEALRKDWAKKIEKAGGPKIASEAEIAELLSDKSVYNLSSIIVLVESKGKRILLTGDARSDDILQGLKAIKLLKGGTVHLEVLKMPHHGSCRNIDASFLAAVTADHYVISADGKYGNPDTPTLELLTASRGADQYTIHLTNKKGQGGLEARLTGFFTKDAADNTRKYTVEYLEEGTSSFTIIP